jgi:hypothetical protein
MAIQRMIDEDRIPPKGPDGKRVPANIVLAPTHRPSAQPVALGLR